MTSPRPMATSSTGDDANIRGFPQPWGARWRDRLAHKVKRHAHASSGRGLVDSQRDLSASSRPYGESGSLFRATSSSSTAHITRYGKPPHSASMGSLLFRRFDVFPHSRYRLVQPFRPEPPGVRLDRATSFYGTCKGVRQSTPFVAYDMIDKRHVLLTRVPKTAASVSQVDHVHRVMLTLTRMASFQRLLHIYDQDNNDLATEDDGDSDADSSGGATAPPSWVFVQEFETSWIPLDLYCDADVFTEDKLRRVTFDVVSMLHFLHTHHLTASGQLCASQDFVVDVDTQRVVWLVAPTLVLSGCLLAHATPVRCARDISAVGYLMFHLSMVPHAASLLNVEEDGFEELIQDHLRHLSLPCRALMVTCLTGSPTLSELIKSQWLRHVDFVSIIPKLGHAVYVPQQQKRLALHALLWKLVSFFAVDWLGNAQQLGAFPSSISSAARSEDEELERRSIRKTPSRRVYVGGHVSLNGHHHHQNLHHQRGMGGRPGANLLKQGMIIVPPLGSAIIPHDDEPAFGDLSSVQARSFVMRETKADHVWAFEDAIHEVSAQASNEHTTPYDSFGYDFPRSPSTVASQPEYDAFDDLTLESLELEAPEEEEGHRSRVSSLLLHENGHNHSLQSVASISDLRNVVRSLHPSQGHSWGGGSDESIDTGAFESAVPARAFSTEELDAVHLSAFGPGDISFRETFRIDVWAYLRQQRREMLETALEVNESEVAQRLQPMQIARGTLVTVSIDSNDRFGVVGDECKSFRWRGDINGVSFDMFRKKTRRCEDESDEDDLLCIARVVAGTKVSLLFIRLRSSASSEKDRSSPVPLSARLEHLAPNVPEISSMNLEPVRPIGKGAFGEAMLAIWKERSIHVVIKSPHQDPFQADTATLEEFRHEAAVMQMLGKHPHVVELLGITTDAGASNECTAIVTEYLSNGSLHDFLTTSEASRQPDSAHVESSPSSPLSLFSRTVMARDAAHGIVNIHQGHVLHRDIAARNCLLDEHFRVKVCDFGLSRLSSKANNLFFDDEHHGFGPIKWMAPESALPPHLFSTHSDSYMFGVLMYEIFSGELPFAGVSSRAAMALILEGQHVPIPEYLPQTHQQLMKACFDPHPLSRPSMDQIFTTLDQWILQDTRHHSRVPVGIL